MLIIGVLFAGVAALYIAYDEGWLGPETLGLEQASSILEELTPEELKAAIARGEYDYDSFPKDIQDVLDITPLPAPVLSEPEPKQVEFTGAGLTEEQIRALLAEITAEQQNQTETEPEPEPAEIEQPAGLTEEQIRALLAEITAEQQNQTETEPEPEPEPSLNPSRSLNRNCSLNLARRLPRLQTLQKGSTGARFQRKYALPWGTAYLAWIQSAPQLQRN